MKHSSFGSSRWAVVILAAVWALSLSLWVSCDNPSAPEKIQDEIVLNQAHP